MQSFKQYLEFIRYVIGSIPSVPESAEGMDWANFYRFCIRQSIAGLVFDGVERSGMKLPRNVLFEWLGVMENIKNSNQLVNRRCLQICHFWEERGYRSCILKGQANALMYPRPELRSPGDIDVWVKGDTVEIIKLAQKEAPEGHYSLHHVTMPVFNETSVEVHYRPIFLDNRLLDRKLKKYVDMIKERQFSHRVALGDCGGQIGCLTDDFNVVYQLLHMWHHFFSTRNNLKQLVDYYFLLKRGLTEEHREQAVELIESLGVTKYARGIMWVMHETLGMEERHLLMAPDEKIGKVVLNETLSYGKRKKKRKGGVVFRRLVDNSHLFRYFPSSVIGNPMHLVWHQWWKWKMKRKLKH